MCDRAVSVECRLERREFRGCGNMETNSGQNESFEHFGKKIVDRSVIGRRTWTLLEIKGKMPGLKKGLLCLERIGDRIRAYFLSKGRGRE